MIEIEDEITAMKLREQLIAIEETYRRMTQGNIRRKICAASLIISLMLFKLLSIQHAQSAPSRICSQKLYRLLVMAIGTPCSQRTMTPIA